MQNPRAQKFTLGKPLDAIVRVDNNRGIFITRKPVQKYLVKGYKHFEEMSTIPINSWGTKKVLE